MRTPFQIASLSFASFGVYQFYWLIRSARQAQRRLGIDESPGWHVLGLLVPFVGLFLFFGWLNVIDRSLGRVEAAPPIRLWVFGLLSLFIAFWWRAPDPWSFVSTLDFVPFIPIAFYALRAERRFSPGSFPSPRLSGGEVVLLVVGIALVVLYGVGTVYAEGARPEAGRVVGAVLMLVALSLLGSAMLGVGADREART